MATLREVVDTRFGGVLSCGPHSEDSKACALEALSVAKGIPWTDAPMKLGVPDIRPMSDSSWSSDKARANGMIPVVEALMGWERWSVERRKAFVLRVAERTIREILPIALRRQGWEAAAIRCEQEGSQAAARDAARAAARATWAATWDATGDAAGDAGAARATAWAAAWAAAGDADKIPLLACRIWIETAEEVEEDK